MQSDSRASGDGPQLGELVLNGRYELLAQVAGSVGGRRQYIGAKGICRYCAKSGDRHFRKLAHTFPEALGNKWVFSNDECDGCNIIFSAYESALVAAVSPVLTLGGVRGKGSSTRQTGRSNGRHVLKHSLTDGKRGIIVTANDTGPGDIALHRTPEGLLKMKIPIPATPFKPRLAYTALAKMGVALLPSLELDNCRRLREWLHNPHQQCTPRPLNVGMSFASIGNSPEMVCGTVLRRVDPQDTVPHLLFIFCAGSVCIQLPLISDRLDEHLPHSFVPDVRWQTVVGGPEGRSLIFDYRDVVHCDWSSPASEPQPIAFFWFEFDEHTREASLTPVFR